MVFNILWAGFFLFLALFIWWGFYSSNLVIKIHRAPQEMRPDALGLRYEDISFPASDGLKLKGWFIPADHSQKTIIVCHGWSAERSNVLPSTAFLHKGGYNLLYFDFRNHGESEGDLCSVGPLEIKDLEGALGFLENNKRDLCRWIGVWGLSMGAAVSLTTTALQPRIQAVVAESPFSSCNEAIIRFARLVYGIPRYPLTPITLLFVKWRLGIDPEPASPIYHMDRISPRPLLLIQGTKDLRMPPSEGRALFERARDPKELWMVSDADHGETYSKDPQIYEQKVLSFFNKASRS